jgi:hypothetical protein
VARPSSRALAFDSRSAPICPTRRIQFVRRSPSETDHRYMTRIGHPTLKLAGCVIRRREQMVLGVSPNC